MTPPPTSPPVPPPAPSPAAPPPDAGWTPGCLVLLALALGGGGLLAGYIAIGFIVVSATGGVGNQASIGAALGIVGALLIVAAFVLGVYAIVRAVQQRTRG